MAKEVKPSEVTDVYWISKSRRQGIYPNHTEKGGKWLVFVPMKDVDKVWAKIEMATVEGKLGSFSKVSTARPNPNSPDPSKHVICVYTCDWTDEEYVRRIRSELRELGISGKIPYKADEDTLKGRYRVRGKQRISKYYE